MDDLNSTEEIFNAADTNNDQQLTQEEAKALPEVDTTEEFKLADKNKDKLISFDEYMNANYTKALQEENRNNEKGKYNAFSKTLNDYYNEYVGSLDQADPDYDAKVALAKDNAEEQLKDSGYWGVNPDTGKDFIISQDADKKSISKDARVKSRINDVLNNNEIEHNVGEMAELLNDVIPSLPEYKETEKYENGKRVKEGWEAQKAAYDVLGNEAYVDYSGLGKVKDTGEIWQENVLKDVYERLSKWNFDELYELSQKAPNIRWKKLANAVARGEVSDKEGQRKRSKEWMQEWKDYVSKVDLAAEHLNKISNDHIDKEEVEQILYRDYVQDKKEEEEKKPIQITEKTDVRERVIKEAARHIIKHGRSLPKELKESIQEMPAKFVPFKFDHDTKKEDSIESSPITFDNEQLGIEYGNAAEGNIPNGSVMQSGFGGGSGGISGGRDTNVNTSSSRRTSAGGMSLPDIPEPKFNMGSIGFEGIGSFSKKKHPINIKMPKTQAYKGSKKALEFPDLSPDVEQHNEMEGIPESAKKNRPIIKRGLYQDKDDKWDNDLYSNVISDIIDQHKKWEKVGDEYVFNIPQLNIKLFYDGFSQPKIKVIGLGNKQNISTLLRREGGREALENLYNYLEGGE